MSGHCDIYLRYLPAAVTDLGVELRQVASTQPKLWHQLLV